MTKSQGSGSVKQPEPEFLIVARVLRAWGVRGEMKVELLISSPDDLARAERVYLGDERRPFGVQGTRLHRRSLMLKLAGIDTPEQVDALRGQVIRIGNVATAPLRPNQYYQHQILGLEVVTVDGEVLGKITEILETGANDVYVARGPRGEVLLPARVEVIRQVDLEAGRMIVALLPGLI